MRKDIKITFGAIDEWYDEHDYEVPYGSPARSDLGVGVDSSGSWWADFNGRDGSRCSGSGESIEIAVYMAIAKVYAWMRKHDNRVVSEAKKIVEEAQKSAEVKYSDWLEGEWEKME